MVNLKKNMPAIGGILVVISIIFSRYMFSKYGEVSRVIIISVALVGSVGVLIGIICTKKYLAAFGMFMMIIPLVVMSVGMYLDNIYISGVGFLLIFILIPLMIKILTINKRQIK